MLNEGYQIHNFILFNFCDTILLRFRFCYGSNSGSSSQHCSHAEEKSYVLFYPVVPLLLRHVNEQVSQILGGLQPQLQAVQLERRLDFLLQWLHFCPANNLWNKIIQWKKYCPMVNCLSKAKWKNALIPMSSERVSCGFGGNRHLMRKELESFQISAERLVRW